VVESRVNKLPNPSAIAGFGLNSKAEGGCGPVGTAIAEFVLNFKEEGGCGKKLPLSELVAQIGLLEVPDTTQ
jgi:hypothetical protein